MTLIPAVHLFDIRDGVCERRPVWEADKSLIIILACWYERYHCAVVPLHRHIFIDYYRWPVWGWPSLEMASVRFAGMIIIGSIDDSHTSCTFVRYKRQPVWEADKSLIIVLACWYEGYHCTVVPPTPTCRYSLTGNCWSFRHVGVGDKGGMSWTPPMSL